jgi:hypothetical protein
VHEEIIFTGNISRMVADKPECERSAESLRRLGAKVQAANITATPLLRWWLRRCGYDLVKTGRGLIGLSNSLALTDDSRTLHISSIQTGLKLPRDYNDDHLRRVVDQMQRPHL